MEKSFCDKKIEKESDLNLKEDYQDEITGYILGLKTSMHDYEFKSVLTIIQEIIQNEGYINSKLLESFKQINKLAKEKLVLLEKSGFEIYYDLWCLSEINYIILLVFCKEFNKTKIQEKSLSDSNEILIDHQNETVQTYLYSNKTDEKIINSDLINLINVNFFFETYLSKFLDYLIEYNSLIRSKDFLTNLGSLESRLSEIFPYKIVIRKIEYVFDLIFFGLKYIFSSSNNVLKSELEMDLNSFTNVAKSLFSIIFEYLLLNYKQYSATINDKLVTLPYLENYLTLSILITSVVSEIKFYPSKLSYGIDFYHFCPTFSESFADFFFSHLSLKCVSKINDYLNVVENIKNFNFEKFEKFYFSPYLVSLSKECLSDFIILHFKSFFINENNYEVENKSSWLKPLIQCFCFMSFLEKLYHIIVTYLDLKGNFYLKKNTFTIPCEEKVIKDIFSILISDLDKVKIIIPRRLIILKDYLILTNLIIFNYILLKLPCGNVVHSFSQNSDFYENLNELKKFQNKFFFILCNNILKWFHKDQYIHELRIYSSQSSPFDYFDIQESSGQEPSSGKILNFYNLRKSNRKKSIPRNNNQHINADIPLTLEEIINKTEVIDFKMENFNIKNNKENVAENIIKISKNYVSSKSYKKTSEFKACSLSFEITNLKFLNLSFLKSLENKTNRKIKFSTNKKGGLIIKFKNSNPPAVIVLTQTDKEINVSSKDFTHNLISYANLPPQSQSFQFLKDMLSQDLLPKFDMDLILSLECESSEENFHVSQPLSIFPENKKNSISNLQKTLKYYDANNEFLSNDEVTQNLIKLFN
jgi:hypothetical protein